MNCALDEQVAQALEAVPLFRTMKWLSEVASHDRYQASRGILLAADGVAAAAKEIGLHDVRIELFEADGHTRYWTFQSPTSWTPTLGRLEVLGFGRDGLCLDHAEQPFLLATYSAATEAEGVNARLALLDDADLRGCIVVLDGTGVEQAASLRTLPERGALGFVSAAQSCIDPLGREYSGRVELDAGTPLFGFSVTAAQHRALRQWAQGGAQARATVQIDRSAPMPVVSALLLPPSASECAEGAPDGEVWLTAHLCHPRPGANDNASGVAGLLGVGATLQRLARDGGSPWTRRRHAIRLIWAPEFVGTAAALHSHLRGRGAHAWPLAVLNLDMIGEDQSLCDCPLILEHSPEGVDSPMGPVAAGIVSAVFRHTAAQGGRWRSVPFLGYSDHALFAGPHRACPAVQLTHWPDRFNHSAADSLDKVSPLELRRSIAAASVLAHHVADDYQAIRDVLPIVVDAWCESEETAATRIARHPPPGVSTSWTASLQAHVGLRNASQRAAMAAYSPPVLAELSAVLSPDWIGPLNLRAMMQCLSTRRQAELVACVRADKQVLAVLGNFIVRADGHLTADQIAWQSSLALRRPLDGALTKLLFDALYESGWICPHSVKGVADRPTAASTLQRMTLS
jgi:hypothetical protein